MTIYRLGQLATGVILGTLLCGGLTAHAQSGMRSVEAVSTGGGTSALSGGPAALYANPAFLTVGDSGDFFEIQLFRVGAYSGGDLFQFGPYETLFTRKGEQLLSDAEEEAVLDEWFGSSLRTAASYMEVVPVSITYRSAEGRWAVGGSLRGRVVQKTAVNRGLFDLLLQGTSQERTVPVRGYTRLYNTVDVTGAFSYRFPSFPLSLGISPRFILGSGYADGVLESEVEVREGGFTHHFDYTARAAGPLSTGLYDSFDAFSAKPVQKVFGTTSGVAGIGGGLDVGMSYGLTNALHLSASVTDLGRIWWNENAQTVTPSHATFRFDGLNLNTTRLNREYEGNMQAYVKHQVDSLARAAYRDVERKRAPFRTGLPTAVHVSSTWAPGAVIVNGGVSMGLGERAGAVSRSVAVHAGGEVALGPFPIRAGVRVLGTQALTVSGGFGLEVGTYRMDVGASVTPETSLVGKGARYGAILALGRVRR